MFKLFSYKELSINMKQFAKSKTLNHFFKVSNNIMLSKIDDNIFLTILELKSITQGHIYLRAGANMSGHLHIPMN